MAEYKAVATQWDDQVGDVLIKNLQTPKFVDGSARPQSTGIYVRYYDKTDKKHAYAIGLYSIEELSSYPDTYTYHLRALDKFTSQFGKASFCLGFALDKNLVVKRNSCSNIKKTGDRKMDDHWYFQLVAILKKWDRAFNAIGSDDDDKLVEVMRKLKL
jgi:hypothetical protein